jgi:CheY-like chemotaxis protein
LDGLEATRRFRRWEKEKEKGSGLNVHIDRAQQQIIVGMSANSDEETIQAAFDAGVNEFITKPFQIETFTILAQKIMGSIVSI